MVRETGKFKTKGGGGGGSNFSRGAVLDNGIAVSRASRGVNAKKEDATGTRAGAAHPQLTSTERRKLYEERAAQKPDGTGGASSRDLVLDQNGIAASRAHRGENAKKEGATGTRAGAAQRQPTRTEQRKLYEERAAQKPDRTGGASSRHTVHEIAVSRTKNGKKEDAAGTSVGAAQPELTRAKRRELKKQQAVLKQAIQKQVKKQAMGETEDADFINLNHVKKKFNISDLGSIVLTGQDRKAKEEQEAKERYWKLHLAGKTEEAKSDLARLKKIREEREAAQAERKAEAEAKAEIEAKKAAMSGKRV